MLNIKSRLKKLHLLSVSSSTKELMVFLIYWSDENTAVYNGMTYTKKEIDTYISQFENRCDIRIVNYKLVTNDKL